MNNGVSLADPARIDVRGSVHSGNDVEVDVNCVFIGNCTLGNNVVIGPNCVISDSHIGDGSVIKANSILENAQLGSNATIGPFARLRPGTVTADGVKVGNFVETKNASLGVGSKVNHLSYVGDSKVGNNVNVGAGTITCNYEVREAPLHAIPPRMLWH